MNPRSLVWLASSLMLGQALSAQTVNITSATRPGLLTWTTPFTNSSSALLFSTNLNSGVWLPARQVLTTGAVFNTTLPEPKSPVAFYRVQAQDVSNVPTGMTLVPGGTFMMGDYQNGAPVYFDNEKPVHAVMVSSFLMAKFETSNEEMRRTMQWAYDHGLVAATASSVTNLEGDSRLLLDLAGNDHGYPLTHLGFSNGVFYVKEGREQFPSTGVTWCGAMAYCNYRSDMEGLQRCITFTNRINQNVSDWSCDFSKNGYRLPTEAEWEKAARGGFTGHYYPWESFGGSYEQHWSGGFANCSGSYDPYEVNSYATPVGYYNGLQTPPGPNMANGYGLYDMAGNVWEWCWDYYQHNWYSEAGASADDSTGPDGPFAGNLFLQFRVIRGGGGGYYQQWLRNSCRHLQGWSQEYPSAVLGFRPVRRL